MGDLKSSRLNEGTRHFLFLFKVKTFVGAESTFGVLENHESRVIVTARFLEDKIHNLLSLNFYRQSWGQALIFLNLHSFLKLYTLLSTMHNANAKMHNYIH